MTKQKQGEFSVYLDNSRARESRAAAYVFQAPADVVIAAKADQIRPAFDRLRQYLADGYYVAGWISYEAGLFLEDRLAIHGNQMDEIPFLSFGVYQKRQSLTSAENEEYWAAFSGPDDYEIGAVKLNISRAQYQAAVSRIHEYLKAGDIYQVNYTLKAQFGFHGRPESYFSALRKAQRVEYGAFIKSDDLSVLSLSPELFFRKSGADITARPMKGTCPRGRTLAEDRHHADFMQRDEKSRAENLMIVDLLRNDLSRISAPASVHLQSLYDVEKYRTLFQMTSTIGAKAPEALHMVDLITALFPCGSVTGAPKIRAMEIISELEQAPRGIYTGAIGYMAPDGDGCFSVPIRTIILDRDGQGEMGIGSAIVADSDVAAEYDECLLKARFATRKFEAFDLIETLRWSGEYHLLDLHLDRLQQSAEYFDFVFPAQDLRRDLMQHAEYLDPDSIWKVRLLLSEAGQLSLTSQVIELPAEDEIRLVTLSEARLDSQNSMLFHKTTDRRLYDREFARHQKTFGSYDVIFVNERGHLTEGSYNNLFLKRGETLITPPLDDGLLDGVLRRALQDDPKVTLVEQSLTPADLLTADQIFMGNSVRGLVEVSFKPI